MAGAKLTCLSQLLLVLPLIKSFTYDRCSSQGPAHWAGTCTLQTTGSPIDLCGAFALPSPPPSLSSNALNSPISMTVFNTGHTVQLNAVSNQLTFVAGNLAGIVGRATSLSTQQSWTLVQVHLHGGRTGNYNEGSEHYLQGVQYVMEAHVVFFNNAVANTFDNAVASGRPDAVLVIGVLFQLGSDSSTMQILAQQLTNLTTTPVLIPQAVNLSDLVNFSDAYYSYAGSLTTPGCNEVVTWMVMKTTKTVSEQTLNLLKQLTTTAIDVPQPLGLFGNFRPQQSRNGRPVWVSDGASAPCGRATQPLFPCNGTTSGCPGCAPDASCLTGACVCRAGFRGNGTSCDPIGCPPYQDTTPFGTPLSIQYNGTADDIACRALCLRPCPGAESVTGACWTFNATPRSVIAATNWATGPACQGTVFNTTLTAETVGRGSPGTGTATLIADIPNGVLSISNPFGGLAGSATSAALHCCTAHPGTGTAPAVTAASPPGFPSGVAAGDYAVVLDMWQAASYSPAFLSDYGGNTTAVWADVVAGLGNGTAYWSVSSTANSSGELVGFYRSDSSPASDPALYGLLGLLALPLLLTIGCWFCWKRTKQRHSIMNDCTISPQLTPRAVAHNPAQLFIRGATATGDTVPQPSTQNLTPAQNGA